MRCGVRFAARLSDFIALVVIAVPTVLLLLPQFVGVLRQAEIIVGHAFVTHEGKKRGLIDASCSTPATSTTSRSSGL